MSEPSIWIVEAKATWSPKGWHPMTWKPAFGTRQAARDAARQMFLENQYNQAFLKAQRPFRPLQPAVRYRARMYVAK